MTKAECVEADTKGQDARRAGRLAEAREALKLCSDDKCPNMVKSDCVQRLDELDHAQPTIVFDVKNGAGEDVTSIRVTVDGHLLTEKVDGSALAADPGEHTFAFTAPGQPAVTKTFVLKEGEKGRRERVVIGAEAPTLPKQVAAAPPSPPPVASGGMGGQKVLGLVLGAAGVAGLAAGGVFGELASSAWSSQKSDCGSSTDCPNRSQAASDHNTLETDGLISTIGFIGGGALLVAGVVLFLTGGSSSPEGQATGLVMMPAVGPSSASFDLHGSF